MDKKNARQLYLMRILLEQTDESHALTLQQIIEKMAAEGIPIERRAVYADLDRGLELGLRMSVAELEERGSPVHHNTREAWEYIKAKLGERDVGEHD